MKFKNFFNLYKTIRRVNGKWCVFSLSGRNMGCYDTREEAEQRLSQIERFKEEEE